MAAVSEDVGPKRRHAVPAAPARTGFRPDIEGLRAVAILLVVLYHAWPGAMPGGYVGVDVFFVISGFLITGQLVRELEERGRISFLGFYARRARRILPAATLVIVSTVVASCALLPPLAAKRVVTDAVTAAFFGVNFRFAAEGANYFSSTLPPSPLQHFWSLSVEEQFYVLWPLLIVTTSLVWLGRRAGPARRAARVAAGSRPVSMVGVAIVLAGLGAVSLLASALQTPTSPSWAYYSIVSRGWELAAGALAGIALPLSARLDRRVAAAIGWAGVAAIALAAGWFGSSTPYPGYRAVLPVLGAVAVVVAGAAARRASWAPEAFLRTSPFQRVGAWSYSWYLWHWPALILAPALLGHALSVSQALLVAALSLIVAAMSFTFVERPIRRLAVVVRRPVLGLAGGLTLGLTSIVVAFGSGAALPSLAGTGPAVHLVVANGQALTGSALQADLVAGVKTTKVPSNLTPSLATASNSEPIINHDGCHLQYPGTQSKPCAFGDTTSKTVVAMFGDSHMAAWFPALNVVSKEMHWRLLDFTKAGCMPPEVTVVRNGGTTPYPECTAWRTNTLDYFAAHHPAVVFVSWDRSLSGEGRPLAGVPQTYGSVWQDGVAATFQALEASSTMTIFLSPNPPKDLGRSSLLR